MPIPKIVGIVNITEDSFSDGGAYLAADAAITHANQLIADGADIIELGPASSHPESKAVADEVQIARLAPVLAALGDTGVPVSVDAARPAVQRFAIEQRAAFINDIQGFPDPGTYRDLAVSGCSLVLMHSVVSGERAGYVDTDPEAIVDTITAFLEQRCSALIEAGVDREKIIVDPGMGFFLGTNPETSLTALRGLRDIKSRLGLPMMVCVSRKSFLQRLSGKQARDAGAASLAAEMFAADEGADYIRTHDVAALRDALTVRAALTESA
ncbi:MAG: dihydropteroate synthase [Alphaproteobacteria bacterium]